MRWKRVWLIVALVVWSGGCALGLRGSALVLQARIKAEEAKNNPPPVEEVTTGEDGSNSTSVSATTGKPKPHLTGIPQKDYIYDPNLPRELKGHDLSSYPFYNAMPPDIEFECDGLHDGFYASVPHHCQVYHHCLFGTRYDFLCANYTAFDQKTFICHFVSEVDCENSPKYYKRNEALYKAATTAAPSTTKATTTTTTTTVAPPPSGGGGGSGGRRPQRRRRPAHRRRRPIFEYYYDDEEYDDQDYYEDDLPPPPPRKSNRKHRPQGHDKSGYRRRAGGQYVRKRPPPPSYSEEEYDDEEQEHRPMRNRKGGQTPRRGGPQQEEDYPRNRNRPHRKGYRDEEDDLMPHERYSGRGGGGGARKWYHQEPEKTSRGGRKPDRRPYYEDEDEDYEYYDDEKEIDNQKNTRNRKPVQPPRNKFRSRNEEERTRTGTSTTPSTTTTTTSTTPRYEKPQRLSGRHKIKEIRESEEDYEDYEEQEASTTSGRPRFEKEDNRGSTTPRDTLSKYSFRPRQELTSSTTQPTTTTTTTTAATTTTKISTTAEPTKRFRAPSEVKIKMKAVLRGKTPFSQQDSHEKTTSSEELESSAEVSQRPVVQEVVEPTTNKYGAPNRQPFSRRPLRPLTTTTDHQDKEEDEERPQSHSLQAGVQQGAHKAGGPFNARRPFPPTASEAPPATGGPQAVVFRRPIKIVVDQPRKYPADFQNKPDYPALEQPRGFANGRRPPSITLSDEDSPEERQVPPSGLNYRNPFRPAENDEEEEQEPAGRPNGPDRGPNYRRPFKTKEPERGDSSRENSEEGKRPFRPVKENNAEPAAVPPPPPEEKARPLAEDYPTGPAREPSGFKRPDQVLPVRTFTFFNTRPKRPQQGDSFPQQPPKQIELTAPGPSGPAEGSTLRPINVQQSSFQDGFRGLADLPEEEYDVTLNDALQPSTLHPTQSLLQQFQPRIKTRGFQSAVAHPQYQRGTASYLVPSATQQFYSKVQQEGPRDNLPQGTILDAREYEALVVPAPRFNQPRFKQRTRPREWYW